MAYKLLLISLPLAGPALYLAYLHLTLSRKVQCRTTPYLQDEDIPIPDSVQRSPKKYIIHHESARKTISTASLGTISKPDMLTRFLRHTMVTFSRYPPAWGIWYLIKDVDNRKTFHPAYIYSLQFLPGDRVCGVYVVTPSRSSRDGERIVLALNAPMSYTGPRVEGFLIVEVTEGGDQVTFVNHTVMWREKGEGSAGVLEGVVGRWMHGLMVRRLVESGVRKLLADFEEKKDL